MTPEYLNELADLADPDQLWRLLPDDRSKLGTALQKQLDAGVALRRYASHVQELLDALDERVSLLVTPLSRNATAHRQVPTPADHARMRRDQTEPTLKCDTCGIPTATIRCAWCREGIK